MQRLRVLMVVLGLLAACFGAGPYLLFLVNAAGVPSEGRIVLLR
jgi:hypothetical protein